MECKASFKKTIISSQVSERICFTSIAIKLYISCHIFTCVRFYCADISIDGAIVQMSQQFLAFMKLSSVFVFIWREGRLFGSLSTGCCCRLNGKNLQMFGVNLCIVSPLGAVLVHNLEGRGDSELCA